MLAYRVPVHERAENTHGHCIQRYQQWQQCTVRHRSPDHEYLEHILPRPRWKVYPGFPRGLPWVPVFSPVFVRFPYIKRSPLGSRVFSGFHSFYCDPQWSTPGSHRNTSSAWVPSPIPVDGGSWRTGAQENTAVRAHGRRFIKKGMCRMRRGYASGVLAQVLQMQGSGAHTHHV